MALTAAAATAALARWTCSTDRAGQTLDTECWTAQWATSILRSARVGHTTKKGASNRGDQVSKSVLSLSLFLPLTSDTAWRFNLAEADYHFGFFFAFFFQFGVQCVCRSALLHDRSIRVLKFVRVCGRIDCIDYPFG